MDICSRDLKAYVLTATIFFSDEVSLTDTSDFVKLFQVKLDVRPLSPLLKVQKGERYEF